jgi:catechol 2,3-dioxygenase
MSFSPLQSHQAPTFVGSVHLIVRDLERMTVFYRDVVGLALLSSSSDMSLLGCGETILLHLRLDPHAKIRGAAIPGLFHTAFLLPTRGHLGAWLWHAMATQVSLEGLSDHVVSEAAYFSDPEGNGVEIYVDRSRDEWFKPGMPIPMGTSRMDVQAVLATSNKSSVSEYKAPATTRIGHVHLSVSNLIQAGQMLVDVFGLRKTASYPQADFFASGHYHHHIAVNTWQVSAAKTYAPGYTGLACVTLQVPDVEHRQAIALRMLGAGGRQEDAKIDMAGPCGIPFSLELSPL